MIRYRSIVPMFLAGATAAAWGVLASRAAGEILPGEPVDRGLYPKAYGLLASEHLMFPVDMADWPVRVDASHQLFIDDYLIASTKEINRQVHQAQKHPDNPIMVSRKPWERFSATREGIIYQIVRRDEKTGCFRMWYAGFTGHTLPCGVNARFPGLYAESADGITWERPELGLHAFNRGTKAELLDASGKPVGPYRLSKCEVVTGDQLKARITWADTGTIQRRQAVPLRLVFELKNAKLSSFWIM